MLIRTLRKMSPKNAIKLNDGNYMPIVGLGSSQLFDPNALEDYSVVVEEALTCGYRHIDTAFTYGTEGAVGKGIRNWMEKTGGKREDVFVCTKLPSIGMIPGGPEEFAKKSLKALGLDYIDLYLVHGPFGLKPLPGTTLPIDPDGRFRIDVGTDIIAVWKEMEKLVDLGLVKSIGLSSYNLLQVKKTFANARIPPAVLQAEFHVYFQQRPLVKYCLENNIQLTAFAPLGSPGRGISPIRKVQPPRMMDDPVANLVAKNHGKTSAQVLLKFLVQKGISVIPKSANPQRMRENLNLFDFELTDLEMRALESLERGLIYFNYKEYPGLIEHPECP